MHRSVAFIIIFQRTKRDSGFVNGSVKEIRLFKRARGCRGAVLDQGFFIFHFFITVFSEVIVHSTGCISIDINRVY